MKIRVKQYVMGPVLPADYLDDNTTGGTNTSNSAFWDNILSGAGTFTAGFFDRNTNEAPPPPPLKPGISTGVVVAIVVSVLVIGIVLFISNK